MAIDWSKIKELEEINPVEGDTKSGNLVPVPSPKAKKQELDSLDRSTNTDPKLAASKAAIKKYTELLKGSSDFVLDVGEHILTTAPTDQLDGLIEAGVEMGTGILGAFMGTFLGADTALTNDEVENKKLLQENFGHEDAVINLNEVPASAKVFLATFNEVAESLTFKPRTETGQAISNFVQTIFQQFGEWGKDAGAFASANGLGPEASTAIETVIAGSPYIVPPIIAKGNIALGNRRIKAKAEKIKIERIEELAKEEILDVIPENTSVKDSIKKTETLEQTPEAITPSKDSIQQISADKVRAEYDKATIETERIEAKERKSIISKIQTGVFDVSAGVKQRLFKQGEQVGKDAAMRHDLIAGATPRAQLRFQRWEDKIYKDMTKEDFTTVNEIIQSRRIVEVDGIKGEGVTAHPGNLTGKDHSNSLIMLNEKLGSKKFNELWKRSDEYFRATNEVLVDLYAEGLLSKEAFKTMKDVVYEPRKFLSKIDPIHKQKLGNQTINVHDSGLHELGRGAIKSLEQDSRALLSEYIVRAENRIARNKANRALLDFAQLFPENGWVKAVKVKKRGEKGKAGKVIIPQGQVRIDTLIDGKVRPMLMDKHMAEQWITQSPQVTANMANFMRITSGSFITRPLATGYNPGFALVNFPRDISHAFLATSEFSNHLPKFGLQMTRDLAVTAKDAWTKKGKFEDFIHEGGGMNFLTHQGTETFVTKGVGPKLTPRWRHVKEAMSKLNEFSEIWTRLAIREQAIRNGKTPEQATHAARDYLDFSQGGRYAKSVDHAIPYFNASIQAFRTTARSAKRDPAGFATKVAWLQAAAATQWLANYYTNPESWEQTSSAERRQNWIITTPLNFIDQQGNKRHLNFKIKKDNTMILPTGLTEMLLERYYEGRVPDKQLLRMTLESLPIGSQLPMPPTIAAAATYASNHDFWTDRTIWKGADVPPEQEFQEAPKKPTPMFWRDVGDMTGLSPVRTEAAIKKLAPQNPYTDLAGMSYKMLTQGLTDFDRSKTTLQVLKDTPILRRIISLTHPLSREKAFAEKTIQEGNGFRLDIDRTMDKIYFRSQQGTLTGGQRTIRTWINAQPQQERERLVKRLDTMRTYDRIMTADTGAQGVPSRNTWVNWGTVDGSTRADLFYWKWRDNDARGRALMERIAGRMSAQGLGFRSDSFNRRFRKNLNTYGREYYGEGESTEAKLIPRK